MKRLKIDYSSRTSISLQIEVEVKFGQNIVKTIEKASNEIRNNLTNMAGIQVKSLELTVKDVFDEEKSN